MPTCTDWGDIATWVTGMATIALFIIGFLQIKNEKQLRINRDKEIEYIKEREQANEISCWVENEDYSENGYGLGIAVLNQSSQPVYQAIVCVVLFSQGGEKISLSNTPAQIAPIGVIPPGQGYATLMVAYHGMSRRVGLEIAFSDSFGSKWFRGTTGELHKINQNSSEYYNVNLPIGWGTLQNKLPK